MSAARCVLLDLDGTLVDTAPDMVAALNALRRREGLAPLPVAELRNSVSQGAVGLVRAGLPATDAAGLEAWRLAFLELYAEHLCRDSQLFAGMETVLERAEAEGVPWGVVTNKPGGLARPLLDALGLAARMACVVAGDDLPRRKPEPDPLLHDPGHTVYVGDAAGDVLAAQAAGCASVVAAWGYIDATLQPAAWGGDHLIDRPEELIAILFDCA